MRVLISVLTRPAGGLHPPTRPAAWPAYITTEPSMDPNAACDRRDLAPERLALALARWRVLDRLQELGADGGDAELQRRLDALLRAQDTATAALCVDAATANLAAVAPRLGVDADYLMDLVEGRLG